jgi:outer membrane protein assembly factor BamB
MNNRAWTIGLILVIVAAVIWILSWYPAFHPPVSTKVPWIKWSKSVGGESLGGHLWLGKEDTLYVASPADTLYAFDSSGAEKWVHRTDLNDGIVGGPIQDDHGNVYFITFNKILSLSASGLKQWEFACAPAADSSRFYDRGYIDGETLYAMCAETFYALNRTDGTELWRSAPDRVAFSTILNDGTQLSVRDGQLVATSTDGSPLWKYPLPAGAKYLTRIDFGADESIYINAGYTLVALTRFGERRWDFPFQTHAEPVIAPDGTVLVVYDLGRVGALNPDGSPKWLYILTWNRADQPQGVTPVLGKDGILYVAQSGGIVAISPQGNKLWEIDLTGTVAEAPILSPDGTLYITTRAGFVYAVQTSSKGPAETVIPKTHYDHW